MILKPFLGLHDPVSSLSHLFSAGLALAGSFALYRKGASSTLHRVSVLIFSASLLFLFSMSGTYHALDPGPARDLFRRLDYAAIFIVIAGSATPVQYLLFKGHWRWSLTAILWTAAITALVLLQIYFTELPYWEVIWIYVGLSSLGLVSFIKVTATYGFKEASLLYLGGIAYVSGAVIDWWDRPVLVPGVLGAHELFHFLVMAGAILHWCFIYNWKELPDEAPEPAPAQAPVAAAQPSSDPGLEPDSGGAA